MPYRRLPNTDAARIRAMEQALNKGQDLHPFKLAFSAETYVRLQAFLPNFNQYYQLQKQSYNKQVQSDKEYQEFKKKAKTYINHFLRVMHMAVQRKDLRQDTSEFFGLINGHSSLPTLTSEKDIIYWGNKVLEGEAARIRTGRTPITNPTIAVVKVHYEKFLEAYHYKNTLYKRTRDCADKISELRNTADELIVNIWNEVENTFSDLADEEKRLKAEDYGLIYVFRKNEIEETNRN